MERRSTTLFCLALVAVAGAALAGGVAAGTASQTTADDPLAQQEIDADDIVMAADVAENGDAQWRVAYRIRLDSDEEIQAFEGLQADVEANRSAYLGPFADRMARTVADAENATQREMTASEFQVSTDRQSQPDAEFGVVTYQFQWSGFAAVENDGDRLRAGDAIDRLVLDDGVRLQVRWPDAFAFESADPDLDDRLTVGDARVVWTGPLDFDTGQPRVVVSRTVTADDAADGTDETAGDDGTDDVPADESGSSQGWALFVALVVIALVAGAGGFALWDRSVTAADDGDDSDDGTDGTVAADAETDDGPPPELLSNEERVLQLLDANGGRMKQQAVAEQLDWTAAKTSQVVSDLREDDEVESFRLGRENVLTLPDVDIDADTGDEESDEQE